MGDLSVYASSRTAVSITTTLISANLHSVPICLF